MKYHILHDVRTSNPFNEKSSDHFKDLHKLIVKFLTKSMVSKVLCTKIGLISIIVAQTGANFAV